MGYRQRAVIYVVLLVTCGVGPAAAGTGDWQPEMDGWVYLRRIDNIELYHKPVAGSRFPALLARAQMEVPAVNIYRIISDYDHFTDFVPALDASRVLAQSGANTWVYQRLGLPMLIADRHYVIRVTDTLEEAHNGLIRVNWQLDGSRSYALSPGGAVLPEAFTGFWRLSESPDDSGCEAIYAIHIEPGGRLPAWLFSRAAERYVIDAVEAVHKRAMMRK